MGATENQASREALVEARQLRLEIGESFLEKAAMTGMGAALELLQDAAAGKFEPLLEAPAGGLLRVQKPWAGSAAIRLRRLHLRLHRLALPTAGHGSNYRAVVPKRHGGGDEARKGLVEGAEVFVIIFGFGATVVTRLGDSRHSRM